MFNIEALRVNSFSCGETIITQRNGVENDPRVPSFIRNCLRSFKQNIEPTLPECAKNKEIRITTIITAAPPATGEAKKIIVIPKSILCTLEGRIYTGKHYAFLMTHPLPDKKTSANICYSTNPTYDLYLHNHLLIPDRTTSAAAPYWILDIVLGPFISLEKAIECTNEWVSNTRGIESKRKRAVFLARIYNVNLYSTHMKSEIPLKKYLTNTAPISYIDSYRKMTGEEEEEEEEDEEMEIDTRVHVLRNKKKI